MRHLGIRLGLLDLHGVLGDDAYLARSINVLCNGSASRSFMLSQQRFDHVPTSSSYELIRADNSPDTVGSAALNASAPQVTFLASFA
jgi:hypothetical protein